LTYSEDWIFTMPLAAQPAGNHPNTAVGFFSSLRTGNPHDTSLIPQPV
jgi:hypothetical protein